MIKLVKGNLDTYYNVSQAKIIKFKIAGSLHDRDKGDIISLELTFDTEIIDENKGINQISFFNKKLYKKNTMNHVYIKSENYYKLFNINYEEFLEILQESFEDFLMNQSESIFFFDAECDKAHGKCKTRF